MIFRRTHIRLCLPAVVLAVLLPATAGAQPWKDFKYKFVAKVIRADSAVVIPNCHVINKTQKMGTVSDEYGSFTITANVKDSVEFSAIGYAKLTIAVHDSMYTNTRVVRLQPVAYALSEVNIGLFSTYDRFKRDVMNTRVAQHGISIDPISKYEIYTPPLPGQGGISAPGLGSPVTFIYNLLSKEGRQRRRYLDVINGTADHVIIGEKFNGLLVYQLTGLKDDELVAFMSSCMFTKEYLLLAPQQEINRNVMRRYGEYLKRKREKGK